MRIGFQFNFIALCFFGLSVFSSSVSFSSSMDQIGVPEIVGGETAEQGEFPFQVSIQDEKRGHFCGGSLIASRWVLTAAHCMIGWKTEGFLLIGLHDREQTEKTEKFFAKRVITHPRYNRMTSDYDIALVELDGESQYTPISINSENLRIPSTPTMRAWVIGWGMMRESSIDLARYLQKVEVPLVQKAICNAKKSYNGAITDQMLCAGFKQGAKDSCQSDSGGPLFFKSNTGEFLQIGIVSFGNGCGRPDLYGVYTKLDVMVSWIEGETK